MDRLPEKTLASALIVASLGANAGGLNSPGIAAAALLQRLSHSQLLLIDVRNPDEYFAEHIPGAINIPVPRLQALLDPIKQATDPVLYCNDTRLTRVAEQILRRNAVQHFSHLDGGLAAWRRHRLPLECSWR
jgi:rhodanese-related sulfurtransferase